jgi:cyclase
VQRLTNKVCAETNYLAPNVGYIKTSEGAVLIDSPFLPKDARDWREKIISTEGTDIACVINTDHHFDHIMGNCFLTKNTIAHKLAVKGFHYYFNKENLFKDIKIYFPEKLNDPSSGFDQVEIIPPRIVFNDELTLYYGDTEINLKYVGGHSLATILIYVPSEKILFAGDNIENNRHPAMRGCKFDQWVKVLQDVEKMDIDVVVPGHGAIGGKDLVAKQIKYFEEMISFVTPLKKAGMEKNKIAEQTEEHMLSYLPVTEDERILKSRNIINAGAIRLYEQIK